MNNSNTAKSTYKSKIETLNAKLQELDLHNQRFSNIRLFVFITIVGIAGLSLLGGYFSFWWIFLPVLIFVVSIIAHDKTIRQIEKLNWSKDFYDDALHRINNSWQGKGITRTNYVSEDHLFARDLDIFGKGSLFELMCTAKTTSGEQQLATWLTQPSSKNDVLRRQEAIKELSDNLQLREDIYLCTRRMRSLLDPKKLSDWAVTPKAISDSKSEQFRLLFLVFGIAAVGAAVSCFFTDFGLAILAGVAIIEWIVGRFLKNTFAPIIVGIDGPRRQLKVLSDILLRFEQQDVQCSLLKKLKSELIIQNTSASASVARLGKLVDWLDQAKNQVFAPIAFLLMWNGHFALSIEKWRCTFGQHIDGWLDATGKLEALCAIAGYTFEHPNDSFPTIEETTNGPIIEGTQLGHPLLADDQCIQNSISLSKDNQVWVVSGSNMSGKSTFLRVIGINAVLAMCGAPVCGKQMRLTPVAIGSTIRVVDSLQKGASRFYAEISTLKQIVELTDGTYPLLFLLDEIFHGTNSHDRKIGAQAVVKELVDRGAVGLVTTHDLALTKAAEELGEKAKNVHFEDTVKDSKLFFDYSLKQGPVTKSNALELMRSVGLKV